jgi:hypothetical protein
MMRKILFGLLFSLPVILWLPHLDQFVFQPASQYSDMAVTHVPNGIFIQQELRKTGTIPTWSDTIMSGYPFAADPLSGLHYPPGWLALLFPLPLGDHIILMLHLMAAGWGAYFLLRSEGICEPAAILGGLVFEAMPKLYAHLGAGHLTLLYAVCLTPWLLYTEKRAWNRRWLRFVLPGFVLGCIALADVRWAAYAGLAWVAYCLRELRRQVKAAQNQKMSIRRLTQDWTGVHLVNILLTGMTAAPLLLPLVQWIGLSTRAHMLTGDNSLLSLPPSQLLGLVYPNIGGPAEWMLYPGASIFLLAVLALVMPLTRRGTRFWSGALLFTLVLSLGAYMPMMNWILGLPGLNLLRVPPRALFLTGLSFSMVSGYALHDLLLRETQAGKQKDATNLVIFTLAAFFSLLAGAVWMVISQPLPRIQFTWGAFFLLAGAVVLILYRNEKMSPKMMFVLFTSICLVDMIGVNALSLVFIPADEVFAQGKPVADFLSGQEDIHQYRIYSPSYSLPQQTAAQYQFTLADGIDPMQLAAYSDFMKDATGVQSAGYSVTLPPFASGSPESDNQDAIPDAHELGLVSVKYIVSAFPLVSSQLDLLKQVGDIWVYTNPFALPRAWIQPPGSALGEQIIRVTDWTASPGQLQIQANGPGLLVLSELDYPGWQVTIDGKAGQVEKISGLLRGTQLEPGKHRVIFTFVPVPFMLGIGLFLAACLLLSTACLFGKTKYGG